MGPLRVFIGHDQREQRGYDVCRASLMAHTSIPLQIDPVSMASLGERYQRPCRRTDGGQLWDEISNAPMATEFSLARFWVPALCDYQGWALFCDCDFLFRADVARMLDLCEDRYAAMVVKHKYLPRSAVKMDGRLQVPYPRKLWSALVLWNCQHPANKYLADQTLNTLPGGHLHRFAWLSDAELGELPVGWHVVPDDPLAVHMTEGTPDMPGHEAQPYASEWWSYAFLPEPSK